jgi:hypothetical protein
LFAGSLKADPTGFRTLPETWRLRGEAAAPQNSSMHRRHRALRCTVLTQGAMARNRDSEKKRLVREKADEP